MKKEILFNTFLTILVLIYTYSAWLMEPVKYVNHNLNRFIDISSFEAYQKVLILLPILGVTLFIGPLITQLVWNKVAINIFNTNRLSYGDSYSLHLFISLIPALI